MAFSPDGQTLASSHEDGTIRLWDAVAGTPRGAPLTVQAGAVRGVALRPDGQTLVSSHEDGTIRLWDAVAGTPRRELVMLDTADNNRAVASVAFSPDAQTLAVVGYGRDIRIWDVTTGQLRGEPIAVGGASRVSSMAFNPDGRAFASVDEQVGHLGFGTYA